MNLMLKQSLVVFSAAVMLQAALPLAVSAATTDETEQPVGAASGTTGDCVWTLDDDGALTISGNGKMGAYSYQNASPWGREITSVDIGYGVTNISNSAFRYCSDLTSVTIPNSVTTIENCAFYGCSALNGVTIPDSVTKIGSGVFEYNRALTDITIGSHVKCIGDEAFCYCSSLQSISLPGSVESIGSRAFSSCPLAEITMGSGLKRIGDQAFSDCFALTAIELPNGVTGIGTMAFSGCNSLATITIPDSVVSIGGGAFNNTAWIDHQPDGLVYAGKVAYQYKGSVGSNTTLVLADGTVGIAANAFSGCPRLTDIVIPDSVVSIGVGAFYETNWYNAKPDGLVYAGHIAYKYKGTMPQNTAVVLEEGTTAIADDAFSNCSGMTSIVIPDSVVHIGNDSFYYCSGLTELDLPESLTHIGSQAFRFCTGLTNLTLPAGVTSVEKGAFQSCSELKHISIPSSVTSIGETAFGYHFDSLIAGVTIYGREGSKAESYANENEMAFFAYGDVTLDGYVNVRDVTALQRYAAELEQLTEAQRFTADANADGGIDIHDATHLQLVLAEYDYQLGY